MDIVTLPVYLQVIFYLYLAVILVQLVYYLGIFRRFSFAKNTTVSGTTPNVSVIVCAKNEAENIRKYLPLLLNQNYPNYELVLIDDASSDDTLEVFEEFQQLNPKIKLVKVVNNEAFWGNKKFALSLGIKAATYDYLLFTDADCYPETPYWIREMVACFTSEKSVVLGYGAYEKVKNSFLNKVIRFETLLTAIQYFSWAKSGKPYMGVGRNMAYHRDEFFKARGFINHMKIRSGDDDLFINEVATAHNVALCYTPQSRTYSIPKKTWKDWFKQKRRHISTARYYKAFDRFQLALFYTSQLLFISLSIALAIIFPYWQIIVALITLRYAIGWIIIYSSARKLKENDVVLWYPVLEITLIISQISLFIKNLFSKPVHWK